MTKQQKHSLYAKKGQFMCARSGRVKKILIKMNIQQSMSAKTKQQKHSLHAKKGQFIPCARSDRVKKYKYK